MPKLTTNYIETKIELPAQGQVIIRDDALQGFAVRVTPGSIAYICEARVAGKFRRVTIGKHGLPWTPESARQQALVILGSMASGIDPVEQKAKQRAISLTLRQAFEEYMESKDFRPSTRYMYPHIITNKLGDWLNKPVLSITRDMVAERFKQLSTQGTKTGHSGKCTVNLTMQILRATLYYVSYKYEVDGMPLIPANPVYRLTQTRAWHKIPVRQGVIASHKLPLFYRAVMSLTNPTARDYYIALLLTGLRRNELPQLVWGDIDFEGRSLHIRQEIGKQGADYSLPLSDFLYDMFARQYDAMSRITSETNALGTFDYAYVDDVSGSSKGTLRLQSISYPNGQMTNFSWYPTAQDERLQQISNLNPSSALLSQFSYRYDSAGEITQWQQIQNNTSKFYQLAYDAAGQLTAAKAGNGTPAPNSLNQNYYAYDCAANRLSQQASAIVHGAIAGAVTSGDSITITVSDPALSGGSQAVTYNVQVGDTLSTISANLAAAITANSNLQAIGVNATSNSSNFSLRSCSKNITSYAESTSGGATETVALNRSANFIENVVVGGTKTTSDSLTLTVYDSALSGGSQAVSYSVGGSDTLDTIAAGITSAINGNLALSTLGVTATSASAVVTITSASTNATTYAESTNSGATETLTLSINQNPAQTTLISGTLTVSDQLKITVYDSALGGGSETVEYTTALGNTTTAMATGLTSAINADTNLQNLGVSATSSGPVITITSNSPNATTYANASASSITELISFGVPVNGTQTAAIAGTKSTGDQLSITVFDAGLSGGSKTDSYTVLSGDTLSSICAGLASVINGDSSLSAIGVSATAVSTVLNLKSSSVNCTTYSQSVSSGATETITLSPTTGVQQAAYNCLNELVSQSAGGNVLFQGSTARPITSAVINPNQTATVGGTITANDILTLSVHNSALSHAENVQYTVQGGDSTTSIATHLTSNINADSNLSGIGVSATSSGAIITITSTSVNPTFYTETLSSGATETIAFNGSSSAAANLASSLNFSGSPVLATGSNTAEVTAVSGGGTAKTNPYQITLNSGSSTSLTFDANGNMTSDGNGNTYSWDAENRLIQITYPGTGNNSQFTYDGLGRNVKILEYTSSSLSSTKQFVWDSGSKPRESRDSSSSTISQYYWIGQMDSSNKRFYDLNKIGSVTEVADNSGNILGQLAYGPFGQPSGLQGSYVPDFGFAGYYLHARSGLNLTLHRAYSADLGRFISRDPIEEDGGFNLFAYVDNKPIEITDPLGTGPSGKTCKKKPKKKPPKPPWFPDSCGSFDCCVSFAAELAHLNRSNAPM